MKNKQITLGALLSYSAIAFNILAGLIYTPWMKNCIGDDQLALYNLSISIISLFMIDFGISSSVQKFLSNYYAEKKYDEANEFLAVVYKIFFIITGAIALALCIFYLFIDKVYSNLTPANLATFKNLFIIVAFYSIVSFPCTAFNGILMANEKFIAVKACNLGQKVFNVLLIVIMLLTKHGVYSLVLVNALSNFVFYAIKYIIIRKKTSAKAKMRFWDKGVAKSLFSFTVWVAVIYIAQRFIFNIMPTLITAFSKTDAIKLSLMINIFGFSSQLEGYVFNFADAINGMFMPRISRILVNDDDPDKSIADLMVNVGRYHVYTIGLIYLGFIVLGQDFVFLWMGKNYEGIYPCALLIIFPSLIDLPQHIGRSSLLAKDKVKGQAVAYIIMAALNILLSYILIPKYGVTGACVSICIAYLVRTSIFNVLYHKHLNLNLKNYFIRTYVKWLPSAAIMIGTGVLANKFIVGRSWMILIIKGIIITAVYILSLFFISIDKKIRQRCLLSVKKILKF